MASPQLKFEESPTESFISTPRNNLSPLFDIMDSIDVDALRPLSEGSVPGTPVPDAERKQAKKRKSWGQQLPEPKTNLPPRKRAKTEDEKEQRRVERVLRNRRAAQSSRERKRLEVEALEAEKDKMQQDKEELERRLVASESRADALQRRLDKIESQRSGDMKVFKGSPSLKAELSASPVTFSKHLFGFHNDESTPSVNSTGPTVSSASISQKLTSTTLIDEIESSNAIAADLTQHPAAMLCDLPCQSETPSRPWMSLSPSTSFRSPFPTILLILLLHITPTISHILSPLLPLLHSFRNSLQLPTPPSPSLVQTIISLVTTPASSNPLLSWILSQIPTSTSTSTLMIFSRTSSPMCNLRLSLLRRILACSPHMARPLLDATMQALRSGVGEQPCSRLVTSGSHGFVDEAVVERRGDGVRCWETLMGLAWALRFHIHEYERGVQKKRMMNRAVSKQMRPMGRDCRADEISVPSMVVSRRAFRIEKSGFEALQLKKAFQRRFTRPR